MDRNQRGGPGHRRGANRLGNIPAIEEEPVAGRPLQFKPDVRLRRQLPQRRRVVARFWDERFVWSRR